MPRFDLTAALREILSGRRRAADLESDLLDFKEDHKDGARATLQDLAEASICFANTAGGTIVLGVRDGISGPEALAGTELDAPTVTRGIYERTRPQLIVDAEESMHDGRRIVVVRIPESPTIHADAKGRSSRRVGTHCLPLMPDDVVRLRDDRSGVDWSDKPSNRHLRDVSPVALSLVRDLLLIGSSGDGRSELATASDEELLRALGLVGDDLSLVNAGKVLLYPSPPNQPPRVVYMYRETPGGEPRTVLRLNDPSVVAFVRVLEAIQARQTMTPITLANGQQLELEDFPAKAVREALANAIVHRDYRVRETVTVDHSPQVLAITSPGPLPPGITPSNILTHAPRQRNQRLAQVALQLRLAEVLGRGVDRMYREMLRSGRPIPVIESDTVSVRVTLVGGAPNTQVARYVATLPAAERDDVDTLLILFVLRTRRTVSAKSLAPVLQKGPDEVDAVLRRLASEPACLLEPTRETARFRNPTYRLRNDALQQLGTAITYNRRMPDEIDRKVIGHVAEYGRVTNNTVRNLLDVSTQRAAVLLRDLVDRGILVKTSTSERGPGVEYGPGPAYARPRRRASSTEGQDDPVEELTLPFSG